MALNPLYVTTTSLEEYFVEKDSGLPLANGIVTFYKDSERTVLQDVFQLTGSPPNYTYTALPNPIILSAVGTIQNANGDNVAIYYYPYDEITGELSLYYITITDQYGNEQFIREGFPNVTVENTPTQLPPSSASSYLVGWDFPLNPFQFGASSSATPSPPANGPITITPGYIVDQTISASSSVNVTWGQDSITGGLNFVSTGTTDAFYILQYLSGDTVLKMLGTPMSVNVFGYVVGSSLPVTMQIYLFSAGTPATIPILPTTIGTISSNGTFTLTAANWNAIPRGGLPIPNVTLSQVLTNTDINNPDNNYGFTGYQITNSSSIGNTSLFAMVVTFAYQSNSTSITINSISLVPGDTPSLPSIVPPDETLLQCQYYYQKSFIGSQVPVQNLGSNTGQSYTSQASIFGTPNTFGPIIRFPVPMRTTPNPVTLYNPLAANDQIRNESINVDWTASTFANVTTQGFASSGTPSNAGSSIGNRTSVHWSADARLGIV